MKLLVRYFKPYFFLFLLLIVFVCGQGYVNLALPGYTSRIINQGVALHDLGTIWHLGFIMILITLAGGLLTVVIGLLAAKISAGYGRRLREAVFTKIENFSLSEFNTFSSSSLITRSTNDIQQIQNVLLMMLRLTFLAPVMGIGAIIKANQLATGMSWITFVAVCLLAVLITILFSLAVPKFKLIQELVDELGLGIKEMLTGIRVIRAYNKDRETQKKFNLVNLKSIDLNIFISRLMSLMQPVMTLIMGLATLAVVWLGAHLVNANKLQVGDVLALTQYVAQTIMSFLLFSIIFIMIPRAIVSAKRLIEILTVTPRVVDPLEPNTLPKPITGLIEFKAVSFSYAGSEQPVLSNISFTAKPGQTTAIIGSTGSGKSTLLNLIPRLYDVTCGCVMLDGIDIRQLPQKTLRRYISYIPQKASLFSGTIKSNLNYGRPKANSKELDKAAEIAQATEFINQLSAGLDSEVAQGGTNLSGGQRQRLSIARALAKNAPVYLFDDSFSALDFKTDIALRSALEKNLKNATIIIVAQRISTIMQADNIIVLDNGLIVAQGRHQDLLRTSPVYLEIAQSQLSADELNTNHYVQK